jgi:hypothetical protein
MGELKIVSTLIRMVKLIMEDIESHVRIQPDLSAAVVTYMNERENDVLASCLLFNIALKEIATDADVQTNDNVL